MRYSCGRHSRNSSGQFISGRIVAWQQWGVGKAFVALQGICYIARYCKEYTLMKPRYSIFSLARNAMNYHKDWERAWRSPNPKAEYDAVIVGAGGHGLATAYYLAKNHKMTNIAV